MSDDREEVEISVGLRAVGAVGLVSAWCAAGFGHPFVLLLEPELWWHLGNALMAIDRPSSGS